LNVLRIIGITGTTPESISVATNVKSGKMGTKDIVKIENRELLKDEVDRIALIAPRASINIIRNFEVYEKKGVEIPPIIIGVVRCPNPGCISNTNEPIATKFEVLQKGLRCLYCDWMITRDITSHII
jgi:aspartate carbamoyltransferase regulatory subunit